MSKPNPLKGKKMQEVSFRSIEEFLDHLPQQQLEIVELLRSLVYECIPHVNEKLSYNVPFFSGKRTICYIWPGDISWGNMKFEGVQFGFAKGFLLSDEIGYLEAGQRKYVRLKTFKSLKDIDIDLIKSFLFEASEIDLGTR